MSQNNVQYDSTIMAINEFIISTTEFLNTFANTYLRHSSDLMI